MPFNLLSPYLFAVYNLNCSVSLIQRERFCNERRTARRRKLAKESEANEEVDRADLDEQFKRVEIEKYDEKLSLFSFPTDLKLMLRYNQNKPLQLVLFLCHLLMIIFVMFKSHVYSSYSTRRDQETKEFVDPVLRFVESKLFVFDFIYLFDRSNFINRLELLNAAQYLIVRLWCLRRLLKVAKVNRVRYKKLNIVDSYFCYLMNLRASTRDWLALFLRNSGGSKISSEDSLSLQVSPTSRNLAKLDNLDNLDRVYFYNQIVFTRSYLGTGIHLADVAERSEKAGRLRGALSEAFSPSLANKRHFYPRPAHPQHAHHLAWTVQLYLIGNFLICLTVSTVFVVFVYVGLHEADEEYIPLSNWRLLLERALMLRSMLLVSQLIVQILVFVLNYWDLGIIGAISILCYSRFSRIKQLLNKQVRQHRTYLSRSDLRINTLRLDSSGSLNELQEADERANMLKQPTLDLNGQVSHLLELVEVLQAEMRDLKAYFTPLLNLYLVIGTISFAATFSVFAKWSSYVELVGAFLCGVGAIGPMLFSLCAGAVYEQILRKIYLKLQSLMADGLCSLEVSVVRRMQRICAHLIPLENRAVVVLGNFPLNFGSLTEIFGWIITGNLLIQRFVV